MSSTQTNNSTEAPIFIVGANRSGTTLLRLMLNAHSRIAIPDELVYFASQKAMVPMEEWRNPGLSTPRYKKFATNFLKENCSHLREIDKKSVLDTIMEGPHDFKRPYEVALGAWANHHGKARWGEKTPSNLFYVDILMEMFPSAQFIYVVRDPRAGVNSMLRTTLFSGDIVFNSLTRRKYATAGRAFFERHVPPSQRMTLRYEDLVRHPEATLQKVCSFLGETYEASMLYYHEDAKRYMEEEAASSFNAAATRPVSPDKIDKWKHQLTAEQVAIVESICTAEMKEFNYSPLGRRPSLSSRVKTLIKKGYWHLQCYRHRHNRHYVVKYKILARFRHRYVRPTRSKIEQFVEA